MRWRRGFRTGHDYSPWHIDFDTYLLDPITVKLSSVQRAEVGDTVSVDLIVTESPIGLGRLELLLDYDEDKLAVIARHSDTLGLGLSVEVQQYLLKHHDRSMSALIQTVEKLHEAALTSKRRITIPLAREVLQAVTQDME